MEYLPNLSQCPNQECNRYSFTFFPLPQPGFATFPRGRWKDVAFLKIFPHEKTSRITSFSTHARQSCPCSADPAWTIAYLCNTTHLLPQHCHGNHPPPTSTLHAESSRCTVQHWLAQQLFSCRPPSQSRRNSAQWAFPDCTASPNLQMAGKKSIRHA